MAFTTNGHPHLVDLSRVADAARPVLYWFEWYSDEGRQALAPEAIADLVTLVDHLIPYTTIDGPIGVAATALMAGGLGHPTEAHLDALDTLDQIANPERDEPAKWRRNHQPRTDLDVLVPHLPAVGSGEATPLQLPGIVWPEPSSPKRRTK